MPFPSRDLSIDRPRRIGILCLSAIPDDPRVRRQGDLFTQAGWEVVAIGLPGHRSPAPPWTCLAIDERDIGERRSTEALAATAEVSQGSEPAARGVRAHLREVEASGQRSRVRRLFSRARHAADIVRVAMRPSCAQKVYWCLNHRSARIHALARNHIVDMWLANDWKMLPVARRLMAEQGVPYGYDTHELAVDEYAQNWRWRIVHRPLIAAVEAEGIAGAAFATCVSDGVADRLAEVHRLPRRPTVIRNTPMYVRHPFRPTGDTIKVLYHGLVTPGRGLEVCVRSVAMWRPDFHLTIRGPAAPAYRAALEEIAATAGVAQRVAFDQPVPMTELVARAASFDVGLFALPGHSLQNVYVLPNKFFEYTMAGLALCMSDLPELTHLLRAHDLGELIANVSREAIAEAINRLDRPAIDRFKRNALKAAEVLNWQSEGCKLLEACETCLRG